MSKTRNRFGIALTIFLVAVPRPALAIRPSEREATLRQIEKQVATSEKVRFETTTGKIELQRPWMSQGALGSKGDSLSYRLDDIRTIHAHRNYVGRGATIGLLAGAALGGAVAAYASAAVDAGQRGGSGSGGQSMGIVVSGAAIGLGLGLLFGAASSGWRKIYEQPAEVN